jgi:hypothetical protein
MPVGARNSWWQPIAENTGDASGARSNIVTSAGGSWLAASMRAPVSIWPPRSANSAAIALVIDCEPPAATGHP